MVDQIKYNPSQSLLRAQQAAQVAQTQKQPTIIHQAKSHAVVPAQATNVQQAPKIAVSNNGNLPRGSIVDKLV